MKSKSEYNWYVEYLRRKYNEAMNNKDKELADKVLAEYRKLVG